MPGELKLWDARSGDLIADLRGHAGPVFSLAFTPDGKTLASGSADGVVKLWDTTNHSERATLNPRKDRWVRGLAITGDGKILASSNFVTATLWNLESRQTIGELKGHTEEICALAISPDGKTIATGGRDLTVKVWDLATARERVTIPGFRAGSMTSRSRLMARRSRSGRWTARSSSGISPRPAGDPRTMFPSGNSFSIAISPDGKTVASGHGVHVVLWPFAK